MPARTMTTKQRFLSKVALPDDAGCMLWPTARNAAKTHCDQGHPLSGENLYPSQTARGCRQCVTCTRERARKSWDRKQAQTSTAVSTAQVDRREAQAA